MTAAPGSNPPLAPSRASAPAHRPARCVVFTEFASMFFDHFAQVLARRDLSVTYVVVSAQSHAQLQHFLNHETLRERAVRVGKLLRYRDRRRARALAFLLRHRDRIRLYRKRGFVPLPCDRLFSFGFMRRIPDAQIAAAGTTSNLHHALLPSYRGCGPKYWPLRQNAPHTGVTLHEVAPGFDTGPILLQRRVSLAPHDTAADLDARMRPAARALFGTYLRHLDRYHRHARPQPAPPPDQSRPFNEPTTDDLRLDRAADADDLWARYRAAGPGRALIENGGVLHPVTRAARDAAAGDTPSGPGVRDLHGWRIRFDAAGTPA